MIRIRDLSIQQGDFGLRELNMQLSAGQYAVLMGRSGCGKTTIMEAICGLRGVRSGMICFGGVDVTRRRPGERNIGYVPQDGALFPTMSVAEQIAFPLRVRGCPKPEVEDRVHELANLLAIDHLLYRRPQSLSGGETQRVAIGRALAPRPAILCLDEPLSALDDEARQEIIALLKDLHREVPVTTLHITHHRVEAEELADVLFVLKDGKLQRQP